jgi:Glu-tRNA(Gln) amidotransferase subunit E-like FAD-binding protein
VKNVNSFRYLEKAIQCEIGRHIDVRDHGGRIGQETRLCDAAQGKTRSMRSKEEAHDYRYFPDPDLLPVTIDEQLIARVRASLPELPDEKREREALKDLTAKQHKSENRQQNQSRGDDRSRKRLVDRVVGDLVKRTRTVGGQILTDTVEDYDRVVHRESDKRKERRENG